MRQDTLLPKDGQIYTPEMKASIKITQKYMADRLLMLAAPAVMAWYAYGERAVRLMVISVLTAVICEYFGHRLVKTVPTPSDLSAVTTGVIIALCLPAASPFWLVMLASAFAVLAVEIPFGNARSLLFSPAAAGLAFVTVCLPAYVFAYSVLPDAGKSPAVFGTEGFSAGVSLSSMLASGTSMGGSLVNYMDILTGSLPSAMGTGCVIALLGALFFLAVRRPQGFEAAAACLVSAAIFAFLFPRITTGRLQSVFMELSGGLLLFTALFLLPEETLLPNRFWGRLLYGACAGLFCMLFRTFGEFEEGAVFAVLLVNALRTTFEKLPYTKREKQKLSETRRAAREAQNTQTPADSAPKGGAVNG